MKLTPKIQARARVIAGVACALVCVVFVGASVATGAFSLSPYDEDNAEGAASSAVVAASSTAAGGDANASDIGADEDASANDGSSVEGDGTQAADAEAQASAEGATASSGGAGVTSSGTGSGNANSSASGDSASGADSTGSTCSAAASGGVSAGSGSGTGSTANSGSAAEPSANNNSGSQSLGATQMIQVSVVIDASAAANAKPDAGYGGISRTVAVSVPQGSNARDALVASGANVSGSVTYITGIDGLYEKACSSGSGWMYSVNGVTPMKPASAYVLSAGDVVRWYYVV